MLSKDYRTALPQIGRVDTGLGPVQLEVVHGDGVLRLDPNTAIAAGYFENLVLGDPIVVSVLSKEPGYLYRTCEMQLAFTLEELYRLFRRDLQPREFHYLYHTYGSFFEIHEDFYVPATGQALQPLEAENPKPHAPLTAPSKPRQST
jgi:hypothetical protein